MCNLSFCTALEEPAEGLLVASYEDLVRKHVVGIPSVCLHWLLLVVTLVVGEGWSSLYARNKKKTKMVWWLKLVQYQPRYLFLLL